MYIEPAWPAVRMCLSMLIKLAPHLIQGSHADIIYMVEPANNGQVGAWTLVHFLEGKGEVASPVPAYI